MEITEVKQQYKSVLIGLITKQRREKMLTKNRKKGLKKKKKNRPQGPCR